MRVQRHPDACWGVVEQHLVLWSPVSRRLHLLNSTAEVVWRTLEAPMEVEHLVAAVAQQFDEDPAIVDHDVRELISQLRPAELLVDPEMFDSETSADKGASPLHSSAAQALPGLPGHTGLRTIGPLSVLGCSMVVQADDQQLVAALSSILAPLRSQTIDLTTDATISLTARVSVDGWIIESNDEIVRRVATREQALRGLLAEVNSAPLLEQRSNVVLHAAGVSFLGDDTSDGRDSLVVFPGVSNSGKSTLAAQLCDRGHGYLTDEAVAISIRSLNALPFHKALCVEPAGQLVLSELDHAISQPLLSSTWDVDPRRIGDGRLAGPSPIDAFVFPTYHVGSATSFTSLAPFDTLQRLIANAFDFGSVGPPAFDALVGLANSVPAYSLRHGGDGSQLAILEDRFGGVSESVSLR